MPTWQRGEGYTAGTSYAGSLLPVEDLAVVWASRVDPEKPHTWPAPRRLVLMAEDGTVAEVLAQWRGAEISGYRCDAAARREAAARPGRVVCVEWLGGLGWVRYQEVVR